MRACVCARARVRARACVCVCVCVFWMNCGGVQDRHVNIISYISHHISYRIMYHIISHNIISYIISYHISYRIISYHIINVPLFILAKYGMQSLELKILTCLGLIACLLCLCGGMWRRIEAQNLLCARLLSPIPKQYPSDLHSTK